MCMPTHTKSCPTTLKLLILFPPLFQVLFTLILLLNIYMAVVEVESIINSMVFKDSLSKDMFLDHVKMGLGNNSEILHTY